MLYTFTRCQNLAKPKGFGDICETLLPDPYVLFLVTEAMFFDGSNISTLMLCRISKGTFKLSLVAISQAVSEERSFEKMLTTTTDDETTDAKRWQKLTWPSARWAKYGGSLPCRCTLSILPVFGGVRVYPYYFGYFNFFVALVCFPCLVLLPGLHYFDFH